MADSDPRLRRNRRTGTNPRPLLRKRRTAARSHPSRRPTCRPAPRHRGVIPGCSVFTSATSRHRLRAIPHSRRLGPRSATAWPRSSPWYSIRSATRSQTPSSLCATTGTAPFSAALVASSDRFTAVGVVPHISAADRSPGASTTTTPSSLGCCCTRVDSLSAQIDQLTTRVDELIAEIPTAQVPVG